MALAADQRCSRSPWTTAKAEPKQDTAQALPATMGVTRPLMKQIVRGQSRSDGASLLRFCGLTPGLRPRRRGFSPKGRKSGSGIVKIRSPSWQTASPFSSIRISRIGFPPDRT
ncbi:hypothetical protein [Phreatobacter oligotrophus]|jgi:hypothetical protein|uniref:hypothetical protein n=1 Tax=Phreatobacter oligotrophus TaxID=1122261 RepID=UPI0011B22ECE|nr:hypothetical protein [Phreatobacter oligotrophus]